MHRFVKGHHGLFCLGTPAQRLRPGLWLQMSKLGLGFRVIRAQLLRACMLPQTRSKQASLKESLELCQRVLMNHSRHPLAPAE